MKNTIKIFGILLVMLMILVNIGSPAARESDQKDSADCIPCSQNKSDDPVSLPMINPFLQYAHSAIQWGGCEELADYICTLICIRDAIDCSGLPPEEETECLIYLSWLDDLIHQLTWDIYYYQCNDLLPPCDCDGENGPENQIPHFSFFYSF